MPEMSSSGHYFRWFALKDWCQYMIGVYPTDLRLLMCLSISFESHDFSVLNIDKENLS